MYFSLTVDKVQCIKWRLNLRWKTINLPVMYMLVFPEPDY